MENIVKVSIRQQALYIPAEQNNTDATKEAFEFLNNISALRYTLSEPAFRALMSALPSGFPFRPENKNTSR